MINLKNKYQLVFSNTMYINKYVDNKINLHQYY